MNDAEVSRKRLHPAFSSLMSPSSSSEILEIEDLGDSAHSFLKAIELESGISNGNNINNSSHRSLSKRSNRFHDDDEFGESFNP